MAWVELKLNNLEKHSFLNDNLKRIERVEIGNIDWKGVSWPKCASRSTEEISSHIRAIKIYRGADIYDRERWDQCKW